MQVDRAVPVARVVEPVDEARHHPPVALGDDRRAGRRCPRRPRPRSGGRAGSRPGVQHPDAVVVGVRGPTGRLGDRRSDERNAEGPRQAALVQGLPAGGEGELLERKRNGSGAEDSELEHVAATKAHEGVLPAGVCGSPRLDISIETPTGVVNRQLSGNRERFAVACFARTRIWASAATGAPIRRASYSSSGPLSAVEGRGSSKRLRGLPAEHVARLGSQTLERALGKARLICTYFRCVAPPSRSLSRAEAQADSAQARS